MASTTGTTKLTISIIGVGVVGKALSTYLEKFTNHEVLHYDPYRNMFDNTKLADVTFISVPVPTRSDGSQDVSILEGALSRAGGTVFIRSTVLPGTNDRYNTFSCPEFLTARTAYHDTVDMDVITGCPDILLMEKIFPDKKITHMSNVEAEIAKYAHNCFGAVKVNFFNLIYNLCEMRGASYEKVLEGVLMSGYINKTHAVVPGNNGEFGYDGTCFPKDIKAFNTFYPTKTFEACIAENKIHRKGYKNDPSV